MYHFVSGPGDDVFLGQRLQTVCQRLKQSIWSDSIWAITVLEATEPLALEDCCYRKQGGKHRDNRHDGKYRPKLGLHLTGKMGQEPVLQYDKDLIHRLSHGRQPGNRRFRS